MNAPANAAKVPTVADYLRAVQAGRLPPPPSAALLGVEIADVGEGTASFSLRPRPELDNGAGAVHGGFLASLADFAAVSAVNDVPVTVAVVTGQLSLSFVQAVPVVASHVVACGEVLHRTRRTAIIRVSLTGEGGCLHVTGNATCIITPAAPADNHR